MTIAFVSTFPPKHCGLATYTKYLCDSLYNVSKEEIVVISEGGEKNEGEYSVLNSYKRSNYKNSLISSLKDIENLNVVHIQHAPDLFPNNDNFIEMLSEIKKLGAKIFITLHTVYENSQWQVFYENILKYSHIIVHNLESKSIINEKSESIFVIPHGTKIVNQKDSKENIRKTEGYSEKDFIFIFLGFIHFLKNLHTVAIAFKRAERNNKNMKLIVAGKPGGSKWYNWLYLYLCKILSGFNRSIKWDICFIREEKMNTYLQICDVILLPYNQKYSSSSGIFHLSIGAGVPFLCSESPKFREVKEYMHDLPVFIPAYSVLKWKNAMLRLSEDKSLLNNISSSIRSYAEKTKWEIVAKEHLKIYGSSN